MNDEREQEEAKRIGGHFFTIPDREDSPMSELREKISEIVIGTGHFNHGEDFKLTDEILALIEGNTDFVADLKAENKKLREKISTCGCTQTYVQPI